MKHGNLFSTRLVAGNNRDVVKLLYACAFAFSVKIHVTLIVDIIGGKACGSAGKSHSCDNYLCALAKTIECFGLCSVDGNELIFALASFYGSLSEVSRNYLMSFSAENLKYFGAKVSECACKYNLHV